MTTGQRCSCGRELPPAWPRADAWGRPICGDCLSHETPQSPDPELLSISLPTGGAYGREGKR